MFENTKMSDALSLCFFYQIDFDGHLPSQKSASGEGALKNVLQHQNVRKGRFLLFESNIYCRKVDRIAI